MNNQRSQEHFEGYKSLLGKRIILLLVIILLIENVYALGVTPARTTIDFSPGLEKTVSITIINSEHKDMNLVIYAQGELNSSIFLNENSIKISAEEESKQLSYNIVLPGNLPPGLNKGEVVILQLPEKSGTSEAYVGSALAVVTQLYVYVPYPYKYAEASLNIVNAEKDGEAVFIIPVVNRGELGLDSVYANVDIYNELNSKVASFNTVKISLESGERKEIVHKWKADVPIGTYRAVVTLSYDEGTINLEKQFNVGSPDLELQQIEVNDFSLGEIAKFEMLIENKWSEKISGTYSQTEVYNKKGEVMADFKSSNYDIPALSKKIIVSYWDTVGVSEGNYETKVYLKYGEKSFQKNLELKVSENNIEAVGLGYVISSAKSDSGGGSSLVFFLIVVIVVLILINILWFLFLRKKIKK